MWKRDSRGSKRRRSDGKALVIARSEATKQSKLPPRRDSGLLRFARNDDPRRNCRVGKAKRAHRCKRHWIDGGHGAVRLCPPYGSRNDGYRQCSKRVSSQLISFPTASPNSDRIT